MALRCCRATGPLWSYEASNSALPARIDPTLSEIGQRTACLEQLSYVDGARGVDAYDVKPE
jgi:hypothetical protein